MADMFYAGPVDRAWRRRLAAVTTVLLLLIACTLHAQAPPPYNGFRPYHGYHDTTFFLGAHGIFHPDLAIDTLHFSFTQLYHDRADLRYYFDSARWQWSDSADLWELRRRNTFYRDAYRRGFKVIYEPNDVSNFAWTTRNMETYIGEQGPDGIGPIDSIHAYAFDRRSAGANDSVFNHHVWGVTVQGSSSSGDSLMGGGARGTRFGLYVPSSDARYWNRVKDGNGNPYQDSSLYFDLGLTLKSDEAFLQQDTVPASFHIGYVLLYRREVIGQQDMPNQCRCSFYTKFDSVPVTKVLYLNDSVTPRDPNSDYREVRHTFKFLEWTRVVQGDLIIRDTTYHTYPVDSITLRTDTLYTNYTALHNGDTLKSYLPTLGDFATNQGWFGWSDDPVGVRCANVCARLLDSLKSRGILDNKTIIRPNGIVEEGDFHYDFHTTRRVPVTFLKGRIGPHTTSLLLRGDLTNLIHTEIDSIYAPTDAMFPVRNPTDSLMLRVGITGENQLPSYYSERIISSIVQRRMLAKRATEQRGMWNNPIADHGSYRVMMGDLDTTDIRMMHIQASQAYQFSYAAPVFYADPARMSDRANTSYYRMASLDVVSGSDTGRSRLIMGASMPDYNYYTTRAQTAFEQRRGQLWDLVDVARHRYAYLRNAPYPVWCVIQVHGWFGSHSGGLSGVFDNDWRPTTPEEITAQSWQALNHGVDGINFSDFAFCGKEFGVMHYYSGDRTTEYDTLNVLNPRFSSDSNWTVPKMWLGFGSRFGAVKRIADEFHYTILPIYKKLDRNGTTFALHQISSFDAIPLIDTMMAERADRRDTVVVPFKSTGTYDPRNQAYMEVTIFKPTPILAATEGAETRYFLVTNLRTWPIDFKQYNTSTRNRFDTLVRHNVNGQDSFHLSGLGNIDARRPTVIFKGTHVMADSMQVQRVGDTVWHRYAIGDTVRLDWLAPGWGAMYRIKPVVAPISEHGTAYNNAIHAENVSTDAESRNRVAVYERDSAVYLRVMDGNGTWGKEFMVSDPNDSVRITVAGTPRRRAHNMFPAIATLRNTDGNRRSCLVVWERRDSIDQAGVEMLYIDSLPARTRMTDSIYRMRLSAPQPLNQSWMQLTPSVVGLDSGYIVAWGSAVADGTELVAVRDRPINAYPAIHSNDTSRLMHARMKMPAGGGGFWPGDTLAQYPTLAHQHYKGWLRMNGGTLSNNLPTGKVTITGTDTLGWLQRAELAYQQGWRNNTRWGIMYNMLGADFPTFPQRPKLFVAEAEHVSTGIPGCEYVHPSIAADSVSVAVAFETLQNTNTHTVTLRFRDTAAATPGRRRWNTPYYKWGGPNMLGVRMIGFRDYERPSVTQFPSLDTIQLRGIPEGILTWHWTNAADGRRNHLLLYRYGETQVDTLPDGAHPTMVLAPYLKSSRTKAFSTASVFHRGDDLSRFEGTPIWSKTPFYYPGMIENTPASTHSVFVQSQPRTTTIMNGYTISPFQAAFDQCAYNNTGISGGIIRPIPPPPHKRTDSTPTGTPPHPPDWRIGMPPTFFPPFTNGPTEIITPSDAIKIARTGTFLAGDSAVTIRRVIAGSDSLIAWLNTQPYDSVMVSPANVFMRMQLVRDRDDAVLWSGDTVSARGLANDTLDDEITIPVHLYAPLDTAVYIRLFAVATTGLDYNIGGGFHFLDDSTSESLLKPIRPRVAPATPGEASLIAVEMIPNPILAGEGELRIELLEPGTATIAIYDLLGNRVQALPDLVAKRTGEYLVRVDLSGLRDGLYLVEARMGYRRGVTRFTVMR